MDKPRLDQGPDYERGFIDGMMYQTQTTVNKAVDAMSKPAQQPYDQTALELCNVCGWKMLMKCHMCGQVYTVAQPAQEQRPWVGLTDEEIAEIHTMSIGKDIGFATGLTEAKLKERNHGT